MNKLLFLSVLYTVCLKFQADAQSHNQPYHWKSVQIRGGGFVDGVIYHPTAKGVLYCRTDMGGAYKWNDTTHAWSPLLDWVAFNETNLMGVESIAIDPKYPDKVYMACGTYTSSKGPNSILRSDDRGVTFKRTDVPFRMGGNENGRGNGERMQVDPNNGNILYMGTRMDGLWKSEDGAVSWKHDDNFNPPLATATTFAPGSGYHPRPNGIIFILFDAKTKAGDRSAAIYAGISQKGIANLFKSSDAGLTWQPIAGEPTGFMPTHAILAADGMLYVTYGDRPGPDVMTDGAVYRLNTTTGDWKDITPVKPEPAQGMGFGYAAVAVDPEHPHALIVSAFHRYGKAGGDDIFRSTNSGEGWKPIFTGGGGGKYDDRLAPYVSHTGIHWLFDLEIDPANPDHAIFTTGYGLHETFDLTDADRGKPTTWSMKNNGIEETVALELLSPPSGVPLISAIGDYGGFVHRDLDKPAPEGNFINPHFANTDGVTCAWLNPKIVVRVGEASTQVGGGNIGYSLDGGTTWQTTATTPEPNSKRGAITVSAKGSAWVWTPGNSRPYITNNNGGTWLPITTLPQRIRVVADKANDAKFYAVSLFDGKLYTSTDTGKTFISQSLQLPNALPTPGMRGDVRGGQDRLYTTPGIEGDLWLPAFDGLYHAASADKPFKQLDGITEIHAFGFGKAAPGKDYPALYLAGILNGTDGIYRSVDKGKTWVRINDDQHRWGLILQITGDPKRYGRVYVGTHGRGIFYGDAN